MVKDGYVPGWSFQYFRDGIYSKEIASLLQTDAIQEMDLSEPCFVSNLFLIPRKSGKLRPVIDLRDLKPSTFAQDGGYRTCGVVS
jgi:hypothetical protein